MCQALWRGWIEVGVGSKKKGPQINPFPAPYQEERTSDLNWLLKASHRSCYQAALVVTLGGRHDGGDEKKQGAD